MPNRLEAAVRLVRVGFSGLVVAFVVFFIMTSPDAAANIFHASWKLLVNIAHGIRTFVNKLAA